MVSHPNKSAQSSPHFLPHAPRFRVLNRASSVFEMGRRKKSSKTTSSGVSEDQPDEVTMEQEPQEKSLYEILGVEKTASQQEIKKAYHRLALQLHPDKNPGDEQAKERFQQLQKVISILGDADKRALYDQSGVIDDADLAGEAFENLHDYFRMIYKKVTEADIEEFEANYRGSDLEKNDLIDLLFCSMLCSDAKLDSHRFKDILDEAIASGGMKETRAYKKWAKQVSETKPPTSPLRKRRKQSKESESDLYAIISQRRSERKNQFESMFSSLISKYGGGKQTRSEPSEEEFQAAQSKLERARGSKKSKRK
ncbi:Chaperone protein dnaJ 6-like protein [Drosera capensis]